MKEKMNAIDILRSFDTSIVHLFAAREWVSNEQSVKLTVTQDSYNITVLLLFLRYEWLDSVLFFQDSIHTSAYRGTPR